MWSPQLREEIAAEFEQPTLWEWMLTFAGVQDIADLLPRMCVRTPPERKRKEGEPCPGCGKHFENRRRGWLRTYCSDKCRRDYHNRKSRPRPVRRTTCERCDAPISQPTGKGKPRRFCSDKCRRRATR